MDHEHELSEYNTLNLYVGYIELLREIFAIFHNTW